MSNEQQQGAEIMAMVNEVTDAKLERIAKDAERYTGVHPFVVNLRQVAPVLDMTVGFEDELAAYKYAYMFRDHSTSRVRVQPGSAVGTFIVIMTPRDR